MAKAKKLTQKGSLRGIAIFPKIHEYDTYKPKDFTIGAFKAKLRLDGQAAQDAIAVCNEFHERAFEAEANEGKHHLKGPKKGERNLGEYTYPYTEACDEDGNVIPGAFVFQMKSVAGGERKDGTEWRRAPMLIIDSAHNDYDGPISGGSELEQSYRLEAWFTEGLGFGVRMELLGVKVHKLCNGQASAEDLFGAAPVDAEGGFVAGPPAQTQKADEGKAPPSSPVDTEDIGF